MDTPINIWSGCDDWLGAALTNMTELAFKKGKLDQHYPITSIDGIQYRDAEQAYKYYRKGKLPYDAVVMQRIIERKLRQYPELVDEIEARGGAEWLLKCSHITGRADRWTGRGKDSLFIRTLTTAYMEVNSDGT